MCSLVMGGLVEFAGAQAPSSPSATKQITLDRIMADPDWLGRAPEAAFFADDGQSFYYRRKRIESPIHDWYQADLDGNLIRVVADSELGEMDSPNGVWSRNKKWKAFARAGDLFAKNLETGRTHQLTKTHQSESPIQFTADNRRLMFRRGDAILARDLKTGLEAELVDIRMEKDPVDEQAEKAKGYLPEQQQQLFEVLRKQHADQDQLREANNQRQSADASRPPMPWYLGSTHRLERVEVSPNGRWCLVCLGDKQATEGQSDDMPEFIAQSGYVHTRKVRSLVGTGKSTSDLLLLLDLRSGKKHELSFEDLPEFKVDRLAEIKAQANAWRKAKQTDSESTAAAENATTPSAKDDAQDHDAKPEKTSPKNRHVQVGTIEWNDSGSGVVVELFSTDNKDRWITTVDLKRTKLRCHMHEFDTAWINDSIGGVQWLSDDQSLLYRTEQSGYAQLYVTHVPSDSTRRLTTGDCVIQNVVEGFSGHYIYYTANVEVPGIYEVYRVEISSGRIEQLTRLGGLNDFQISLDEKNLLLQHSTAMAPPELWIQSLEDLQQVRQVTQTVSAEYSLLPWIQPQFITVNSRAGRPIHARLYTPPQSEVAGPRPAVIFIHGAGYLQNAHQGWSNYFREFMFHSLLVHHGYVVLDMDYRASAGYGRDWRTAIYRHMGGPEVEDLEDGLNYLVEQQNVDRQRVGLYGGSYGGFLTMMALFQKPNVFACGAALRPVTDWAHYNHGYTSNILNTPDIDPVAYERSSPIELAAGLADPLLICHGMVDDNVFFKDTARLAQRLIELRKTDWHIALYPVEPHAFVQPSSWYDEYRRIFELFQEHLNK